MANEGFFDRYCLGDRESVWTQLIELGDGVRDEPVHSEAQRVCDEIVRRAHFNLKTLHGRLLDLGFVFEAPTDAFVEACLEDEKEIERFERDYGVLPMIMRTWYRRIRSVNFQQADAQARCSEISPPPAPDIFGLGARSALLIQSLRVIRDELEKVTDEERRIRWEKEIESLELDPATHPFAAVKRFARLGGDASNCEPVGFAVPCRAIDCSIYDDGGGDTFFVDDLRQSLASAGFPIWQRLLSEPGDFRGPDSYVPFCYRPNFAKLWPILQEGLLEL